jgi:hypothetical protein
VTQQPTCPRHPGYRLASCDGCRAALSAARDLLPVHMRLPWIAR